MLRGRRVTAIVKELRQFVRDPVLLTLVLWLYTIEVVICAVALTFDLHDEPVAVLDLDRSRESAQLADRLDRSDPFAVRYRPADERLGRHLLDAGQASLLIIIPARYGQDLARRAEPAVQLLVDGSNAMTAKIALGDARRLIAAEASHVVGEAPTRADLLPVIENRVRIWYNADLRFAFFMVIVMIALAAYMVGVIHPAAMIVKEKESGTIEHLLVTPLAPWEIVLAKTLPTFVIGMVALGPGLLIARAFDVPFRGDVVTFAVVSAVFLVSAIGTGVLIASSVRTLQQALLVAFFALFVVAFLSGTMTPIESMPPVLQRLSLLSPLRHYAEALLGVFLKGVGLRVLWPQVAWMAGLGVILFGGSAVLFRRRLA